MGTSSSLILVNISAGSWEGVILRAVSLAGEVGLCSFGSLVCDVGDVDEVNGLDVVEEVAGPAGFAVSTLFLFCLKGGCCELVGPTGAGASFTRAKTTMPQQSMMLNLSRLFPSHFRKVRIAWLVRSYAVGDFGSEIIWVG